MLRKQVWLLNLAFEQVLDNPMVIFLLPDVVLLPGRDGGPHQRPEQGRDRELGEVVLQDGLGLESRDLVAGEEERQRL